MSDFEKNISTQDLDELIKERPTSELYNQRGLEFLKNGKLEEAETDFSMAGKLDGNSLHTFKNLGIVSEKMRKFKEAVEYFSTAIKLDPKDCKLYAFRGVGLFRLSKYVEAARDFVISIQRDFDYLWFTPSMFYDHVMTSEETKRLNLFLGFDSNIFLHAFDEAIKIENDNVDFLHCRGILSLRMLHYDDAINYLSKAHALDPLNSYVLSHRSEAFYRSSERIRRIKKQKCEKSFSDAELAVKLDPKNCLGYLMIGRNFSSEQNFDSASKSLRIAVDLNPNLASGYIGLGSCYGYLKQLEKALEMFNKGLELRPTSSLTIYNRARLYRQLKKYDLAIAEFRRSFELNPTDYWVPFSIALCYEKQEKYDLALEYAERCLEMKFNFRATVLLGRIYRKKSLLLEKKDEIRRLKLLSVKYYSKSIVAEPLIFEYSEKTRKKVIQEVRDDVDLQLDLYSEGLKYTPDWEQGYLERSELCGNEKRQYLAAAVDRLKGLRCKKQRMFREATGKAGPGKIIEEKNTIPIYRIFHKIMMMIPSVKRKNIDKRVERFIRVFCWEYYEKLRLRYISMLKKDEKTLYMIFEFFQESMIQMEKERNEVLDERHLAQDSEIYLRLRTLKAMRELSLSPLMEGQSSVEKWIIGQFCVDIKSLFEEKQGKEICRGDEMQFFTSHTLDRHFKNILQNGMGQINSDFEIRVNFLKSSEESFVEKIRLLCGKTLLCFGIQLFGGGVFSNNKK